MIPYNPIIQKLPGFAEQQVDVLRLDLIHPEISGNKWFKLKHNLENALAQNFKAIITFGGAFSNHIAATAAACKLYGLRSIAIIRGEAPEVLNQTLSKAQENGMQLHFVSRESYTQKESDAFKNYLHEAFGAHYLIPEGGNNEAGVLGCKDILQAGWDYDHIFCACGTATTFAGIAATAGSGQSVIGISVLKGENKLPGEAEALLRITEPGRGLEIKGNEALDNLQAGHHCITNNYCFSGYAKCDKTLLDFKAVFEAEYRIPLDYVYTSKLMRAAFDLIQTKKIKPDAKLLIIHSGGLQGNRGFEKRYNLIPGW